MLHKFLSSNIHEVFSFKRHLYRNHKEELDSDIISVITEQRQLENDFDDFTVDHLLLEENNINVNDVGIYADVEKRLTALFMLKTLEIRKVSQTALLGLIDDIEELIESKINGLETNLQSYLSSIGINHDQHPKLKEIFEGGRYSPFSSLNTKYLQEKYYKESLGLLVSFVHYAVLLIIMVIGTYRKTTWS